MKKQNAFSPFEWGVGFAAGAGFLICLTLLISWFLNCLFIPADATDLSRWDRSGLEILTDHETGVEYLRSGSALTPRLDEDGNIIVVKRR